MAFFRPPKNSGRLKEDGHRLRSFRELKLVVSAGCNDKRYDSFTKKHIFITGCSQKGRRVTHYRSVRKLVANSSLNQLIK